MPGYLDNYEIKDHYNLEKLIKKLELIITSIIDQREGQIFLSDHKHHFK